MAGVMERARAEGFTHVAFGDLFLEDVRRYREEKLAATGLTPLFPLWGQPTPTLAEEMMANGLEAVITCVDPSKVDRQLAGRDSRAGCSTTCRSRPTPAASAVNSTRSAGRVRCSPRRFRCGSAKSWSVRDSYSRM